MTGGTYGVCGATDGTQVQYPGVDGWFKHLHDFGNSKVGMVTGKAMKVVGTDDGTT
jgi:hypothetical protein